MAVFVPLTVGNTPNCYVNLDLVRVIQPTNGGSKLIFDNQHFVITTAPPEEILGAVDQERSTSED